MPSEETPNASLAVVFVFCDSRFGIAHDDCQKGGKTPDLN